MESSIALRTHASIPSVKYSLGTQIRTHLRSVFDQIEGSIAPESVMLVESSGSWPLMMP